VLLGQLTYPRGDDLCLVLFNEFGVVGNLVDLVLEMINYLCRRVQESQSFFNDSRHELRLIPNNHNVFQAKQAAKLRDQLDSGRFEVLDDK
jgi:hypothetical protein